MEILLVNKAIPVLVNHVERLFELLDLRLVEHGKDVGGGPLGALLGGLSLGALAGHGDGWIWTCVHSRDSHMTVHILHQTSSFPLNVRSGDEWEHAPALLLNTGCLHIYTHHSCSGL